jgi:serine/threonine-protein kinase
MSAPVLVGEILAGKYRVDRVLGTGGMGVVVAAHHIELDDKVAIKFLLPEMLSNQDAIARFAREARAAVRIKSEHVARVFDVGRLENGAPYMVMEFLEGGDLSAWLSERGALPFEQAVEFVLQACEAIAEAHAMGIVHRDLKPANLFVIQRMDGLLSVKVLDFGISKLTSATGSAGEDSRTKTSVLMGSPVYMSPEQMHSAKDADTRSDVWALGVILYELIAGSVPFVAETMPELVLRVTSAPPEPLEDACPDVPEGLEKAISKCLEKDRDRRYQTVGELAVALLPFAPKRARASVERISGVLNNAGLGGPGSALPSSNPSELAVRTATLSPWGRTTAPKRRRNVVIIAAAGAVLVAAAAYMERPQGETSARRGDAATLAASALEATPAVASSAPEPEPVQVEPAASVAPPAAAPEASVRSSTLALNRHARTTTLAKTGRTPPTSAPMTQNSKLQPPPLAAQPNAPAASPEHHVDVFDDRQ